MAPRKQLIVRKHIDIRRRVYEAVRNQILTGSIPPSGRIVENQYAKQINTSRTPVREALHMLEMEGLLESIPRVGYRVKQMRRDEIDEITEIRIVNETLAARWAIERITPKELDALNTNLRVSEAEIRNGNPRSFVDRDAEFHEILVGASGSNRLLELCQLLRRHMLRYRIETLYLPEIGLGGIAWHHRIVECLRKKDEEQIGTVLRGHLEEAKRMILTYGFVKRIEGASPSEVTSMQGEERGVGKKRSMVNARPKRGTGSFK